MPSIFTNNGGIELPADGEKDGVWGDVTNLNMQIIDRLTNGVGAVSLTGTTHTLTTANGVLSDGQYALVVFGGTPSGTNTVTIVPNDAEKVYFVRNATAQSVIMTQGSGGNVTIPAGAGAIVYANGAGTGAAVADLTATFVFSLTQAGVTASAAELNLLTGASLVVSDVAASAAELNLLTGASLVVSDVAASAAELNQIDGKSVIGADTNILTTPTITGQALKYLRVNAGETAAEFSAIPSPPTQATAVWEAGTDTTESLVSAAKVAAAIAAQVAPVPSGTVIHVAMQTAPSGYLKADGTAVSRTTYAALFAAIGTAFGAGDESTTFNLPDLRGEFVRGFDDGRGVDSGRAFGSAQADELESHSHLLFRNTGGGGGTTNSVPSYSSVGLTGEATGAASYGGGALAQATGGAETRPRNIALLACIKV